MGICHLHFSGSQNPIHKLSAYVLARLAGLSPAAPSPSFLTSLWPRKELSLHNRIWEHKSSTILFSSVQNNSTDRVRCHPWSALIFWNAKIKQYAWPPSAPFDLLFGSNPSFFHHIPENYHNSPCWVFFFFFSFFFGQNGLECDSVVCETTDVSRENSIFPIFQKTWFQAILAGKKNGKKEKKHGVRRFYGVRRSCRVREFYSMCTSLAVECDVPYSRVRRNYGMRRILMPGIETTEGKFGARTKIPIPKPPKLPGAHQLVGSVFTSSPWVRPRGRNWLIFTQPTFKNVPLTTLSFFGRQMRNLPYQSSLQFIQRPQLLWNDIGDRKLWGSFSGFAMAQLFPPDWAEMPIKVTHQNPGLEYDENMVCEDFQYQCCQKYMLSTCCLHGLP